MNKELLIVLKLRNPSFKTVLLSLTLNPSLVPSVSNIITLTWKNVCPLKPLKKLINVTNMKMQPLAKSVKNTTFFHKIKLFVFSRKIEIAKFSRNKK